MLAEKIEQWIRQGEHRGQEQGIAIGQEKGRQEGKSLLLHRLLHLRFGKLPTWAEERIAGAADETLERWADAVLTAETLEGVIGPQA
jgi:predicted transposase YdaD